MRRQDANVGVSTGAIAKLGMPTFANSRAIDNVTPVSQQNAQFAQEAMRNGGDAGVSARTRLAALASQNHHPSVAITIAPQTQTPRRVIF